MVDAAVVLEELGRAVCPAPYASSAIGAVSLVLDAGDDASTRSCSPASPTARRSARVALYERDARYEWRRRRRPRAATATMWRLDGTKVHVADGAAADAAARHRARRRRRARRVRGQAVTTQAVDVVEPTETVDGSPQGRTVDLRRRDRLAARRPGDATRRGRAHARPARGRLRRRRRRRRAARARARGRVREGAGAVRQADRLVPSRATPVRRHAAHGRARPRRRLLRVLGRRRRRPAEEAHRAATLRQRVRERGVRAARRHRDPGVRRHRLHVGARHPPVSTSGCSRCPSRSAPPTTTSPSSPPSPSTPDHRAPRPTPPRPPPDRHATTKCHQNRFCGGSRRVRHQM